MPFLYYVCLAGSLCNKWKTKIIEQDVAKFGEGKEGSQSDENEEPAYNAAIDGAYYYSLPARKQTNPPKQHLCILHP